MRDVFVIIPVYGRDDVFSTVNFLRRQPYAGQIRFVVVDNGNPPELSVRLATLAGDDCKVLRLETNQGGAGAYRAGMRVALSTSADYVWLLDDDAMPNEKTLSGLLSVFEEEAAKGEAPVGVVGSAMLGRSKPQRVTEIGCHVSRLTGLMHRFYEGADIDALDDLVFPVDYCAAASFLVSREVLERVGVFEDIFIHQDDVDFCFRVWEAGYRVLATTRSTVSHPEDVGKFALWLFYFDMRNKRWMVDRHLPWYTRLNIRIIQNVYWLMFRYQGLRSAAALIRLGIRHARTGERLLRVELPPIPPIPALAEIVADADYVGILARPEEIARSMRTALADVGVANPEVVVCWRGGKKTWRNVCCAFFMQLRMQLRVWRFQRPVVFQDCFCIKGYPFRIFCRSKVFFTASGGRVTVVPTDL